MEKKEKVQEEGSLTKLRESSKITMVNLINVTLMLSPVRENCKEFFIPKWTSIGFPNREFIGLSTWIFS